MKKLAIITSMFIASLLFLSNELKAQVVVKVRPVAPVIIKARPVAPHPHWVWIDGFWRWHPARHEYVWVGGYWAKPRYGYVWAPGYWRDVEGGSIWVEGRWVLK